MKFSNWFRSRYLRSYEVLILNDLVIVQITGSILSS